MAKKKAVRRAREFEWNIMVYLAGDNNLAEEMVWALTTMFDPEIKQFLEKVAVFVLYDCGGPAYHFRLKSLSEKNRIKLWRAGQKNGWQGTIDEKLGRLIFHSVTTCPKAKYRMLILSGHGSGAVGDFLKSNTSQLTVPGLRGILEKVQKDVETGDDPKLIDYSTQKTLHILGLDSCLMSMAEVAYEVKEHVDYVIGAEGFEPNTGWPYKEFLGWFAKRARTRLRKPDELAKDAVKDYLKFYTPYAPLADLSTDLSALDLTEDPDTKQDKLDNMKRQLDALADDLKAQIKSPVVQNAILLAHWKAQGYKDEQYVDLWDFCDLLRKELNETNNPTLVQACQDVCKSIINNKLVLEHRYSGAAFQWSKGISVFFPWAEFRDADGNSELEFYRNLRFASSVAGNAEDKLEDCSGWLGFLKAYLDETRRPPNESKDAEKHESRLNWRPWVLPEQPGKYNPAIGTKYNPAIGTKYNPAIGTKSGLVGKISSMKNPPVEWYFKEPEENE